MRVPSGYGLRRILATLVLSLALAGCQPPGQPPVTPPAAAEPQEPNGDELLREFPNEEWNASIVQILAHRDRYHGKRVQLHGYLHVRFEGTAIYLSREDAEHGITSNGFWVRFDPKAVRFEGKIGPKEFDKKYVLIEGTFSKDNRGHLSLWQGAIQDVTRVEELRRRE